MFFMYLTAILGVGMLARQMGLIFHINFINATVERLAKIKKPPLGYTLLAFAYVVFALLTFWKQLTIGTLYTWPITVFVLAGLIDTYYLLFDVRGLAKLIRDYLASRKQSSLVEDTMVISASLALIYYAFIGF